MVSRFQRPACATLRSQGFVGEAMGNCWVLLKPDMTRFLFPKDDTQGGVENEFERNKAGSRLIVNGSGVIASSLTCRLRFTLKI